MPSLPLITWFSKNKRNFPWRENPSPYAVWISEVMLQQTQAKTVIPYFEAWMQRFPTVEALAKAPIEEVIKCWEGLGYYSRARNIHAAAITLLEEHGGKLPNTLPLLLQMKGLGPYTAAAVASFAFHQKAAAVDGNVERVMARYFLIEEDIAKPKTRNKIRELTQQFLPDEKPWVAMEALIELGATLCKKTPECFKCPLSTSCKGFQEGRATALPFKSKKIVVEKLYREVAVVTFKTEVLVKKGEKGKVMADLYEFPFIDSIEGGEQVKKVEEHFSQVLKMQLSWSHALPQSEHGFTRFQVQLYPHYLKAERKTICEPYEWVEREHLTKLPFSSGHRKILHTLISDRE